MKRIILIAAALLGALTIQSTAFAFDGERRVVVVNAQADARTAMPQWRQSLEADAHGLTVTALDTTNFARSIGATSATIRSGYNLYYSSREFEGNIEEGAPMSVLMPQYQSLRAEARAFAQAFAAELHTRSIPVGDRPELLQGRFDRLHETMLALEARHGHEPAWRPAPPSTVIVAAPPPSVRPRVYVRAPRHYRPAPPRPRARAGWAVSWNF